MSKFFAALCALVLALTLLPSHTFANQTAPIFKLKWGSAGTGNGQFGANLAGIAVDNNNNVYVADLSNNRIQKFTTSGVYESQWSVGAPQDVKVDASGNVWVVQSSDKSILKFDPNGNLLSVFTTLNDARQIAFDPVGNVYIDNHFFGEVNKYDPNGTPITSWGASPFPVGIAVDSNSNVYVALNRGGGPINKYDSVGNLLASFPFSAFTMAVDSNNNIFGADPGNHQVIEFAPDGTLLTQWGTEGTGDGQFESPQAVAVDTNGNVYVGDTTNSNIQVFSPANQLTTLNPAKVWVGLKNSDDVGIKFDVKAEVYKDATLVTSGELDGVAGGSSGFNNAKLDTIPFNSFSPIDFPSGSQLSVKLYIRNACTGSGHNSGTARLWFNDSAANSQFGATIGTSTNNYFLLDNFLLGTSSGGGPKKTVDVAAGAKCSAFKSFGTWTITP